MRMNDNMVTSIAPPSGNSNLPTNFPPQNIVTAPLTVKMNETQQN